MQRRRFFKLLLAALGFTLACTVSATTIVIPELDVSAPATKKNEEVGNAIISTQQQIKQQGNFSITDFLNKQGGIKLQAQSNQQNQSAVSIHGFGNNASANSVILIDELPFSSFTSIGPNLNSILVDNIKNIIIKPGSYGSLYGDQAVGGVVDIQTKIPKKPQANLTFGVGNMAQKIGEFFISRALPNNFAISLSTLGYDTNNGEQSHFQNNYNLNTIVTHDGDESHTKLAVFGYDTQIEIPQAQIWQGSVNSSNGNSSNYSDTQGNLINLANTIKVNKNSRWKSAFSIQDSNTHGFYNILFNNSQASVFWQNTWLYQDWFVSGLELQHQSYHFYNTLLVKNVSADMGDIFAQATVPLAKKLDMVLGTRYANQEIHADPNGSQNASVPVNEEGLIWHLKQEWQLFLRRDTNYRLVKANEAVWTLNTIQNLQTQTGVSYETGAKWQGDENNANVDIFILNIHNEIAYDPTPTSNAPYGTMANLPPTQRIGLDFAGNSKLSQHIHLNLQSSAVDPRFSSGQYKGKMVPSVSALNSSAGLTYERKKSWSMNVNENYHSAFYSAFDLKNQGAMMPGYFLTNLNFIKQWRKCELNLEIDNLFNKHYVRFAEFNAINDIDYFPSSGISVLAKLEIKLV